jgi:hypothetical protein
VGICESAPVFFQQINKLGENGFGHLKMQDSCNRRAAYVSSLRIIFRDSTLVGLSADSAQLHAKRVIPLQNWTRRGTE